MNFDFAALNRAFILLVCDKGEINAWLLNWLQSRPNPFSDLDKYAVFPVARWYLLIKHSLLLCFIVLDLFIYLLATTSFLDFLKERNSAVLYLLPLEISL